MKIFNGVNLFWKIVIAIFLIAVIAVLGVRFFSGDEDTWLCQDGGWVKHGNPSAAMPTSVCENNFGSNYWLCRDGEWQLMGNPSVTKPTTPCGGEKQPEEISVTRPQPNQAINSPLIVEGQARGNWFFEGSFPIELVGAGGERLGLSHVQSQSDWMTNDFVPFKGEINYQVAATTTGKLVLKNDNPSGLAQNDKKIEIPVIISPSQTITVKAFFSNNNLDPEITCTKVFAAERQVLKTEAVARVALEQLLSGPTEKELAQGFYTSINPGVKIQELTIAGGIAKVDFDATMENGMGGSCRVTAIRAQINETLKQFSTVKDVIISVNGKIEDILQP